MSTTFTTEPGTMAEASAYGGFVDALGGIATIVLAIIALSATKADILLAIATIVFGAALLIQGGAMLSEFAQTEARAEHPPAWAAADCPVCFWLASRALCSGSWRCLASTPKY